MNYYIIIRGPAASGKTSLSKKLAKKLNAHYISFDKIREDHGIGFSDVDKIKANKIALPEAKEKLENDQIVIFDDVFYHESQLNHITKELTKELDYKHFIFTLKASLEKCLSRHKYGESKISEKSVRDVHELVTEFDYGTVVDTNKKTENETINEILSQLPQPAKKP